MGGKGQRRREKNYKAAHGGQNRLPPPPNPSTVDSVPSKLRQLMSFTNSSQPGSNEPSLSGQQRNGAGAGIGGGINKKLHSKDKLDSIPTGIRGKTSKEHSVAAGHRGHDEDLLQNSMQETKRKAKKRKRVSDLRFETLEESGVVGSKRREHKKNRRLEAKRKKQKKSMPDENEDFPRCEMIKFGEVVQAPPKLVVPKAFKTSQHASQERLRLKAVEAYRNRKGWASRPGVNLPPPIVTSPSV